MTKTDPGRFFEDFRLGQEIRHATPRSVTAGDQALYTALYGTRFALHSSAAFARSLGLPDAPVDDLLVFHIVFGKSVPDISLNAVANLGYADCRFFDPVYPGDSLEADSQVIGLKENSNGKTGVVWVRTEGRKADSRPVLRFVRWVMVNKRDPASPPPEPCVPDLPGEVAPERLLPPDGLDLGSYDCGLAGQPHLWDDYDVGERIDHRDGMTLEEAEHQMATRLYQNTAKVHFDRVLAEAGRFGKRIVYGGHIISLARAPLLQRPGQCGQDPGHQWRQPHCAELRRGHSLCLERDPRPPSLWPGAPMPGRCVCAPWPSRTSWRLTSPTAMARAGATRPSSSISTTGC